MTDPVIIITDPTVVPAFEWCPGMLPIDEHGDPVERIRAGEGPRPARVAAMRPDLNDRATVGALLQLMDERFGGAWALLRQPSGLWTCANVSFVPQGMRTVPGPSCLSRAAAVASALAQAAPKMRRH